jgi:Tol biopolymer transport system component
VAFIRADPQGGSGELWIAGSDGSSVRRLLAPEALESFAFEGVGLELSFQPPAWSPDGTRIAIDAVSTASCGPSDTKCATWYTVVVDLQGRRVYTTGGLNASWSPNGRFLLLREGFFSLEDANEWELAIDEPGGSAGARWGTIDKRPGACWRSGSWSPDGSHLLLVEAKCDGAATRIHVIRTDDWLETAVITGCCATWAPDGSRFAYLAGSAKNGTLTTVNRDGKRPSVISRAGFDAAWSPSADRLTYLRRGNGLLEVVTVRAGGRDVRRVASGRWRRAAIVGWSRDGKRIAFTTAGPRTSTIQVVSSTGGRTRMIHRDVGGASNSVVGWTAGDRRLILVRAVSRSYPAGLWVMRPDGSSRRRLGGGGVDGPRGPAWSPDGSQIAFWRDDPATRKRPEVMAVYVRGMRGGKVRRVVGGRRGSFASVPDWSPDGTRLVFARWADGTHQDLFVVSSDGRGLRRLTSIGSAYAPDWSPDGRTIAFTSFSSNGRLMAVAASGGLPHSLVESPAAEWCVGVAWSPDGEKLAATCVGGLVVFAAGGGDIRVLDPRAGNSAPSWSPDGRLIVYEREGELAIVSAEGGSPTPIDLRGASSADPDWSR